MQNISHRDIADLSRKKMVTIYKKTSVPNKMGNVQLLTPFQKEKKTLGERGVMAISTTGTKSSALQGSLQRSLHACSPFLQPGRVSSLQASVASSRVVQ
jgi:hypothetical protein